MENKIKGKMEKSIKTDFYTTRCLICQAKFQSSMQGHVIELNCIYEPVSYGQIMEQNNSLFIEILN